MALDLLRSLSDMCDIVVDQLKKIAEIIPPYNWYDQWWSSPDVMTEYQLAYIPMTFRRRLLTNFVAILGALLGHYVRTWTFVSKCFRAKCFVLFISMFFLLSSSPFELLTRRKKRVCTYSFAAIISFLVLAKPRRGRYYAAYRLFLMALSNRAIVGASYDIKTQSKLSFHGHLIGRMILYFAVAAIFVINVFGWTTTWRYVRNCFWTTVFQTWLVELTIGLFKINEHNVFVEALVVLWFVEIFP